MAEDEDRSREFEEFVRSHRDVIQKILDEDDDYRRSRYDDYKDYRDRYQSEARDFFRERTNTLLKVISSDEVQKHFITGCLEMIQCMEAIVDAIPKSPEMQDVVDNFEKTKKNAVKNAVVTGAKAETKEKFEKVTITNIKKKVKKDLGLDGEDDGEEKS